MSIEQQEELNKQRLGWVEDEKSPASTKCAQAQANIKPAQKRRPPQLENDPETGLEVYVPQEPPLPQEPAQPEPKTRRPLVFDPNQFTADHFLDKRPPDPEMLFDGCPIGCVMALCAPPGTGKSTFCSQMLATFAAGSMFFRKWGTNAARRSLFLSVEDPEDIVRQRVYDALHGLPEELQREAAKLVSVPPVFGHVSLFEIQGNTVKPTKNFDDLVELVKGYKPNFLVLDTLSRFCGGVEGDNSAMSEACSYIEEICHENKVMSSMVVHHTGKGIGGLLVKDDDSLYKLLDAYAARGASALTASVRWQLNLAPLSAEYAVKKIGEAARGKPDGWYIAARVCKKNIGRPESRIYLERNGDTGLLERVEPVAEERRNQDLDADVDMLVEVVRNREIMGLAPLASSRAQEGSGIDWGPEKMKKVVAHAVATKRLDVVPKGRGNGKVLAIHKDRSPQDVEGVQTSLF